MPRTPCVQRRASVLHARIERIDFAAVMARVRGVRQAISPHDSVARFESLGVDVFLGDARFVGRDAVAVGDATLRFARAVIATGGRPAMPDIPGVIDADPLTNESIFELETQPERLLVIGGGPIGCELAQAFQRLGTQVTLVQRAPTLLGREAPEDAAIVRQALESDGVAVHTRTRVVRVAPVPGHRGHHVDLASTATGARRAQSRWIAFSSPQGGCPTWRASGSSRPAWPGHRKGVTVDAHLRTSNRAVFAAGDVCLPQQFTHAADASARAVIQNALFLGRKAVTIAAIPRCTYTDPEVAHVGEMPGDGVDTFHVALGRRRPCTHRRRARRRRACLRACRQGRGRHRRRPQCR